MKIKQLSSEIKGLKNTLVSYQRGDLNPIVTGREWLDEIFGGLLPGDIVCIAGSSGGGKTYELQRLKNNIMSPEYNEDCNDFVWLSNSLEMRLLSTTIRDLARITKKGKGKVLSESFTEEETQLVADYFNTLKDGRFWINEETFDAETFETGMREFCELHKDKRAVFIDIDHIALAKANSSGKKDIIDDIIDVINRLKKEFKNVYFLILSQLNRGILLRSAEKNNNAAPNRGDLYQSDTIFQICDYVYVTHNPQRLGIHKYLKVNLDVYRYLAPHFAEVKENKISFNTHARIFYHVLKAREAETLFKDIFIEEIEFKGKENFKGLEEDMKKEDNSVEEAPVFTNEALKNISWGKADNIELNEDF